MPQNIDHNLVTKVQSAIADASDKAAEYSGVLGEARHWIVDHFGQNGLIAVYIAAAALILFVVAKLSKLTFSALKYMVVPAIALAFVGSFFFDYSFVALLPVTVAVSSVFLLFKG